MIECVKAGRLHVKTLLQKVQFIKCLKANCTQLFAKSHRDKAVWTNFDRQDTHCDSRRNMHTF